MSFVTSSLLFLVVFFYWSWSLTLLWGWYIVPFGVKAITMPWAMGLSAVAYLLFSSVGHEDLDGAAFIKAMLRELARISIVLFIGFIVQFFM